MLKKTALFLKGGFPYASKFPDDVNSDRIISKMYLDTLKRIWVIEKCVQISWKVLDDPESVRKIKKESG